MRLLWVSAIAPDFSGGGGHRRQAHLLQSLAEHFEVHLLIAGHVNDARVSEGAASVTEVDVSLPPEPSTKTRRRARDVRYALLERRPFEVCQHRRVRAALAPELERLERDGGFAITSLEFVGLAPLLPERRSHAWVLTLHNLSSVMAAQQMLLASGARQRFIAQRELANSARFEAWAVSTFDATVVCSQDDADALPDGSKIVAPNGVDVEALHPTPLPASHRVVFSGALYTHPNADGLEWFIGHVWPRLLAVVPDAVLDVVGLAPSPIVRRLCEHAGVELHENVEVVEPYVRGARVAIAPLRIGSGTRLKALEAMAAGRPLVGTTIGLGGLAVEPGRNAIVADDPEDFAAAVALLLTDDAAAQALIGPARTLVETQYDWHAIGRKYTEALIERARRWDHTRARG